MLLQTNSYIVPKDKRPEHARLMRRFRQILNNLGCDDFEIYEQVGDNWSTGQTSGRFVQIMRFRDRKHQLAVQNAERGDPAAQKLIAEFCDLVNYPYQQQQKLFAVGFYSSVLPVAPNRARDAAPAEEAAPADHVDQPSESLDEASAVHPVSLVSPETAETHETTETQETADEAQVETGEFEETPAVEAAAIEEPTEDQPASNELFAPETEESQPLAPVIPQPETAAPEETTEPEPPVLYEEPEDHLSDDALADLHAELGIEDDDLSRLADQLATDNPHDDKAAPHHHPGENNAH